MSQFEYILVLKGQNKKFAFLEFQTIWNNYTQEKVKLEQVQNSIYRFESNVDLENLEDKEFLNRLTYTNSISKVLLKSENYEKFEEGIKDNNLDLSRFDGLKFRLSLKRARKEQELVHSEKKIATMIWDKFSNPKVDLENFEVEFLVFSFEDKEDLFLTYRLFNNSKKYLERMPKLRPVVMPYTLKSDMARTAINLLDLKSGVVLDPFCGIGGILLEAYDMGFEVIGNDISWNDLNHMKTNFDYYFPNSEGNYSRSCADSKTQFLLENSVDGIISDIPYGKCSRKLGTDLYEEFLKSAKVYLKSGKRMVIIYANFTEFRELAEKYFTVIDEIEEYINKSMTRYIIILENDK